MLQIDKRKFKYFDYPLFIAVCLLGILSVFLIYTTDAGKIFYNKQIIWELIGVFLCLLVANIDLKLIKTYAFAFYIFVLFALLVVFFIGFVGHGAKRWISLGFFNIQPSEFMKLAIILVLAAYFDEYIKSSKYNFKDLYLPFALILFPAVLIIKQPDLGTALIILIIGLAIILSVGVKKTFLIKSVIFFLIAMPFFWSLLKNYQKERLIAFINPYLSPHTYGYHIIQSEIAVGSGGLFGKTAAGATQTILNFLPENHTDFIFAAFCEQWGFISAVLLISLYLFIIFRCLSFIDIASSIFEKIVIIGVTVMLSVSMIFNIGMTIGLLPVVGVPLPFVSYGGSAVITNFIAIGILINIKIKNQIYR
ncbi:rod shape-determining protein RodA [Desulfurella multipotens]|uniref:rod shape-determining protein RodA n=1 Tax=Desulfurella multipotens TaxID=79269 RepID=UPI000CC0A8B0|nr:rod shape-determining protein RodA [Desulfurella multipotens]PMP68414.1 MAG: rod shape-determining protein RodA [Desulfurella multipotens]